MFIKRTILGVLLLVLMSTVCAFGQVKITGRITDASTKEPIPFASVVAKGTKVGVSADEKGKYSINLPKESTSLLFTAVGYEDRELLINDKTTINTSLKPSSTQLDEVVVVAYGTAKREALTGSIATLSDTDIEKRPVTNAAAAMEGMGTGILVQNSYGEPGAEPSIRIRGFSSVTGSNTPLFVVDGVIFTGNINNINPNDIASMSVLKDASSAALYGSKAANGVILITTKKGGKNRIQISINQGFFQRAIPEYEAINADQFMETMWTGYKNDLMSRRKISEEEASKIASETIIKDILAYNIYNADDDKLFTDKGKLAEGISILPAIKEDLDWFKNFERTGHRQNYNISGSATFKQLSTYFSVGYLDEKGYVKTSEYSRFTGRSNISYNVNKWMKLGFNLSGVHSKRDITAGSGSGTRNVILFASRMAPIYPVHLHDLTTGDYILDKNGNKQYDDGIKNSRKQSLGRNALWENECDFDIVHTNSLDAQLFTEISFLKDFKLTLRGTMSNRNTENPRYTNNIIGDAQGDGRLRSTNYRYKEYTVLQQLSWGKSFNKVHNVDAILVHEAYSYNRDYLFVRKQNQIFTDPINLENFSLANQIKGYDDNTRTENYLSRVRYNYDRKYFAEASFRRDGSSRFKKENRWGNFWSLGASWSINKESWMKDIKWVDFVKLRASYGEVGNDRSAGYYASMFLYNIDVNGDEGAAYRSQYPDPNIVWESLSNFTAGIEGRIFKRINFSFEYFNKKNKDLLFKVARPLSVGSTSSSGIPTVLRNAGTLTNNGFEFSIDVDIIKAKDWQWNMGVDGTVIKNKITKLPKQMRENGYINGSQKWLEGKSIYDFYIYQWAGVDQTDGRGLYILDPAEKEKAIKRNHYREINGVDYTTSYSYALKDYSGSAIPDLFGSIKSTVSYKNINVSILCSYSLGGKILDASYSSMMYPSTSPKALHKDIIKSWDESKKVEPDSPNRIDKNGIPVNNFYILNSESSTSTRFLTSKTYFSIKNITISYNCPQSICKKLQIKQLVVGANIENLAIFTKRKGLDSQQSFDGRTFRQFLPSRVLSLSLNVTL